MSTWYSMEIIAKDKIRQLHKDCLVEQTIHREFGQRKTYHSPIPILKAIGSFKISHYLRPWKSCEPGLGDHNAEQLA